jgi:hypothetical protein
MPNVYEITDGTEDGTTTINAESLHDAVAWVRFTYTGSAPISISGPDGKVQLKPTEPGDGEFMVATFGCDAGE